MYTISLLEPGTNYVVLLSSVGESENSLPTNGTFPTSELPAVFSLFRVVRASLRAV